MIVDSLAGASILSTPYSERKWSTVINDLNCTGNESTIWDCPHNSLKDYSCSIYDDASLICHRMLAESIHYIPSLLFNSV